MSAAPLLIAQVGLQRLRTLLDTGDSQVLARIRLRELLTVAETLKLLSKSPPLSVLKLLCRTRANEISFQAAKISAELDFTQMVLDLVAAKDSLNPSVNAVAEAFRKRFVGGVFSPSDHSDM